jgi:outer membrane receptor protein involved in Fe transport
MNLATNQYPFRPKRLFSHPILSILTFLFATLYSQAQTTASKQSNSTENGDGDLMVLNPFVVTATEEGSYLAGESQMGGRLSTPLNETPASISVITRDFLDDLGIINFTEAAGWTPNVVSDYELNGENQFNDYNARFRGLSTNAQSRNFFEWFVNADSYNTERLDFSRGPNAVVFGTADIGGVGNITTKQAGPRQRTSLRLITSEYGGYRAEIDINQPLTDKWYIRLNGLREDLKGWHDYEKRERDGIHFTTKFTFSEKLTVSAEYEYGKVNRTILSRGVFNAYDGWDRTTLVDAPKSSGSFSGGINRRTTDFFYYAPGSGNGILNERTLGATANGGVVAQMLTVPRPETGWKNDVVIPGRDYAHHFFAPNTNAVNPYHTYSVFVNFNPIRNLYLEAAYNHQQQERFVDQLVWQAIGVDVNRVRADGSPNPYVGQFYADATARVQNQKNIVDDFRIAAAYRFTSKFTDQNILLLGGQRQNDFYLDQSEFVRVDAGRGNLIYNNSVNQVRVRRYSSLLDENWSVPESDPSDPLQFRWAKSSNRMSRSEVKYLQVALAGKWLPKRNLSTTIGVRRDQTGPGGSRSAITDPVTRETAEMGDFLAGSSKDAFTTKSAGLVFKFNHTVSAYAGYAESFNPAGTNIDINGGEMDPEVNEGREFGLRFSFFNTKLSATASYYENERTNKRESGASGDINAIWQDLGSAKSVTTGYSDSSSDRGTGCEFEIVGQLRPGWNITANFSRPKAFQTKGLSATKAYYDANIAEWQAGANATTDVTVRDRILQNITDVETRISNFPEGQKLRNSVKYTANLLSTYRFQQGRLKGAWITGGVQMRGDKLVALTNTVLNPLPDLYVDGYKLYTLAVGYAGKVRSFNYRIQLNVTNLLNTEIVRPSAVRGNFTVNGVPNTVLARNYVILDPRKIQLTTTFSF